MPFIVQMYQARSELQNSRALVCTLALLCLLHSTLPSKWGISSSNIHHSLILCLFVYAPRMCTPEQMTQYQEEGYCVLDGIYTKEEMDECCREYDAMFDRAQGRGNNLEATWKGDFADKVHQKQHLHVL